MGINAKLMLNKQITRPLKSGQLSKGLKEAKEKSQEAILRRNIQAEAIACAKALRQELVRDVLEAEEKEGGEEEWGKGLGER